MYRKLNNHPAEKYRQKLNYIKQLIREYVHENAAIIDEIEEVQTKILIRKEERKFLLRKLCEYDVEVAEAVQKAAKIKRESPATPENKRTRRKGTDSTEKKTKVRRNINKPSTKLLSSIPRDSHGRPIFPIVLGDLTIHRLGDIVSDNTDFHTEEYIYPVGYLATRIYSSMENPNVQSVYSCRISRINNIPEFEIEGSNVDAPIIGNSPDICHLAILNRINTTLSRNVVNVKPKGHDFFGLSHPIVLTLIQGLPGCNKCANYKMQKLETREEPFVDENDPALNYNALKRTIALYKMRAIPNASTKDNLHDYLLS